jgi:YbbR domain-containing protein
VRRVRNFLLRNWPLKIGAVLLATVLYSGLVLSQNVRTFSGPVQIEPVRQPPEVALLTELPAMSQIRYRAPLDVIVSPASFSATVDLSRVVARSGGEPVAVPVTVLALDTRVQVVGYEPNVIQAYLDPVEERSIRVSVERGTVPEGLTLGPEQVEPEVVTVRGASTRVAAIRSIVARVAVDASALNVDSEVDLIAVDEQGNLVTNVDIEPPRARVRIAVARELANRTLPVQPVLIGDPPDGLRLASVAVSPLTVTITGDQSIVTPLAAARTQPIDLTDRTRDFEIDIPLDLPQGMTVAGGGQVRVSVTLAEERASRTFEIGLRPQVFRPNVINQLPGQIAITLGGPATQLDQLDPATLIATVDVADLDPGTHVVPVSFSPPSGLQLLAIIPARVEITIAQPTPAQPTPAPDFVDPEGHGRLRLAPA